MGRQALFGAALHQPPKPGVCGRLRKPRPPSRRIGPGLRPDGAARARRAPLFLPPDRRPAPSQLRRDLRIAETPGRHNLDPGALART